MAVRKLWITAEPWPASDAVQAQAAAAGATEILHGVPPTLAAEVAPGTLGYVEVVVPDPTPDPEPDPPEVVAVETIKAEITARLEPADVNSIAEVKTAIREGLAAALDTLRGGS